METVTQWLFKKRACLITRVKHMKNVSQKMVTNNVFVDEDDKVFIDLVSLTDM